MLYHFKHLVLIAVFFASLASIRANAYSVFNSITLKSEVNATLKGEDITDAYVTINLHYALMKSESEDNYVVDSTDSHSFLHMLRPTYNQEINFKTSFDEKAVAWSSNLNTNTKIVITGFQIDLHITKGSSADAQTSVINSSEVIAVTNGSDVLTGKITIKPSSKGKLDVSYVP